MRVGSLCSGYGGLELAASQLWPDATTAWHSEIDPWASKVLAAHWPDVANLGDLTTVDWAAVEPVDVLTAGFPCQPVSTAGRRAGVDDDRWLFDDIATAVGVLRPRLVLLENVRGLLSANRGAAMGRIVHGLARVGYVGRYGLLRASDVGACHRRERVFIVAYPAQPDGSTRRRDVAWSGPGTVQGTEVDERAPVEPRRRYGSDRPEVAVAVADTNGWRGEGRAEPDLRSDELEQCSPRRGDADRCGVEMGGQAPTDTGVERRDRWETIGAARRDTAVGGETCDHARHGVAPFGAYQPAIDRWANVIGRPAPPGLDGGRLNARFVEWMMGLAPGWVTDVVPRRHALRILGNGVVPAQAAAASRALLPAARHVTTPGCHVISVPL